MNNRITLGSLIDSVSAYQKLTGKKVRTYKVPMYQFMTLLSDYQALGEYTREALGCKNSDLVHRDGSFTLKGSLVGEADVTFRVTTEDVELV